MSDVRGKFQPQLVNPSRDASDTVRGFLAQAVYAGIRWFQLQDDEVLVMEGNEDVDVISLTTGAVRLEQVKDLAGRVSARQAAVYEAVFHFAASYLYFGDLGVTVTFVFTVSAPLARQTRTRGSVDSADLAIDVLQTWMTLGSGDEDQKVRNAATLRGSIVSLFDHAVKKGLMSEALTTQARTSLEGLDARDAWRGFLESVQWNVDQPDLEANLVRLEELLDHQGVRVQDITAMAVVTEVLRITARSDVDDRAVRRADAASFIERVMSAIGKRAESEGAMQHYSAITAVRSLWALVSRSIPDLAISTRVDAGGALITATGSGLATVTFSVNDVGRRAREIVTRALSEGRVQRVPAGGLQIEMSPGLEDVLPELRPPEDADAFFVPGMTGRSLPAVFAWKSKGGFGWSLERFKRQFEHLTTREAAEMRVIRDGMNVKEFEIVLDSGLSLRPTMARVGDGWAPVSLTLERDYVGRRAERAARGEQVLDAVRKGVYAGCFEVGGGRTGITWETNGEGANFESWLGPLSLIAALNEAGAFELNIPDVVPQVELLRVASFVELFGTGERTFGPGDLSFELSDSAALTGVQQHAVATGGLSHVEFAVPAHDEIVLGQTVAMPATSVRVDSPRFGDVTSVVALVPSDLPRSVQLQWDDGAARERLVKS